MAAQHPHHLYRGILPGHGGTVVSWLAHWTSDLKIGGSMPSPCHHVVSLDKIRSFFKNSLKMRCVHVCFKPHRTLRQHLVKPKDEIAVEEKCGVIYNIKCKGSDSDWHISKTARKLYTRRNEHRKLECKSAVSEHAKDAGYSIDWASVKLIGQEKPFAFTQDTRAHKNSYSATENELWPGLQPSPMPLNGTILQPHQNKAAIKSKRRHW